MAGEGIAKADMLRRFIRDYQNVMNFVLNSLTK